MINVTDGELQAICKFLDNFSLSVAKVLSKSLDVGAFEHLDFHLNSASLIGDMRSLKGNNAIYEIDYLKGEETSNLATLIPEELIALIANAISGTSSDNNYQGSLTEAQIGTCLEVLPRILSDVERIHKKTYNQNLVFDSDPLFLSKIDSSDYDRKFDRMAYDLIVDYTFSVDSQREYKVGVLFKYNDFKPILSKSRFSHASASARTSESINLEHLAPINIDITAELGRSSVPIKYALELDRGSMVHLDSMCGDDVKVFANGVEVATAQVVVVEENFGLRITKIITPEERMQYI